MKISIAVDLVLALLSNAGEISALITQAKSRGLDEIPAEDWARITQLDDDGRERLEQAIAAADR